MGVTWDASERQEPLVECKCGAKVRRFFGTGMLSRKGVCETCWVTEERAYLWSRHRKDQTGAA